MIIRALEIWEEHAELREGRKVRVYLDSLAKPTVGIGHLVRPEDGLKLYDKISEERVDQFFALDTADALATSLKHWKDLGVYTSEFLAALISVNFQLGDFSVKFKNSYGLIKAKAYSTAIENIKASLWAKQTPTRAEDFIRALQDIKI